MRKGSLGKKASEDLDQLRIHGYVKVSTGIRDYIRSNSSNSLFANIKFFYPVSTGRLYDTEDKIVMTKLLGSKTSYIVDIKNSDEFVEILVEKFFQLFPNPTSRQRQEFTLMLHSYDLHWHECCGKQ